MTSSSHPTAYTESPAITSIEAMTLEVPDPTAAERFYTAPLGWALGWGCVPRRHRRAAFVGYAVARGVPAGHGRRSDRCRPGGRGDGAEAGREVALGLRRRRTSPGRDDLEGRDVVEEEHRPGHQADRPDRAAVGSRGRRRQQALLSRPRFGGGEKLCPARTSSSPPRRARSSWRSTSAGPWPKTPVSPLTAPDRTGSSSTAMASRFTDPDGFAWEPATARNEQPTALAAAASAIPQGA